MPDSSAFNVKVGGDLAFLAKKEFDGKLSSAEGFLSVVGDLATITAATGKDMYIARAKITYFHNASNVLSIGDQVVLKINGVIIETSRETLVADSGVPAMTMAIYEFRNMGQKVAASQIIKLEVITLDTQTDVEGFIEVWEEDTGVDPTL